MISALAAAMGDGASPRDIDVLAHLLMGAVMEACLVCVEAADPRRSAREISAAVRKLLEGLPH